MCIIAGLLIAVGVMYRRKKQSFTSRTSAVHMRKLACTHSLSLFQELLIFPNTVNPNYFYMNGSRLKSDEPPDTRLKTGYELLSEDVCCIFKDAMIFNKDCYA